MNKDRLAIIKCPNCGKVCACNCNPILCGNCGTFTDMKDLENKQDGTI